LRPLASDASGEYGAWDERTRARPLENYLSWSPSGFRLAVGYQNFSWGVADKYNPTDNLNPRDFTVGVNADKIPVLAADAVWYPSDAVSVEGVFVPTAQKSIYPVDFEGEVMTGAAPLASGLAAKLSYLYGTSIAVNNAAAYDPLELEPENAIAGGKINYRSSAFDASLSYLYDVDPLYTPSISFGLSGTTDTASIVLKRERIHRFGLDAKTTLGKFGLWTEAAYNHTQNDGSSSDYAHRRSSLNYVIGADVSFGPNDSGYVNFQCIGTWIPGYDDGFYKDLAAGAITDPQALYERALVDSLGLETEGLRQGATIDLKYDIGNGAVTPQLTAVYTKPFLYDGTNETRYGNLALNPEVDIMPVDSFHVKVGADLAYAWVKPEGGSVRLDTTADQVGIYTTSNNVYIKILYKWNYDLKK